MLRIEYLMNIMDRLLRNNRRVHSLRKIYLEITAGKVCSYYDFQEWFEKAIVDHNLVEGVHYSYRKPEDIDSVYVRGHVGADMIRFEDNEYGRLIRNIWGSKKLPVLFEEDETTSESD